MKKRLGIYIHIPFCASIQLMCELDELCQEFRYFGSYTEVV